MSESNRLSTDCADALAVARRAKVWLVLLILVVQLGQVALFFVFRYRQIELAPAATPGRPHLVDLLKYGVGLTGFLGVVLPVMLAVDLLLMVNIMLVGRLVGVSQVVSAFLWSTGLILMLFPWQAFLANANFTSSEFKIPGVLYTWDELLARARWDGAKVGFSQAMLHWGRFAFFPILAVIVLLIAQFKSGQGVKKAVKDAYAEPELKSA